jgi:hypothetical protein
VIYFYNGSTQRRQVETEEVLTGVCAKGAVHAWAVGEEGDIYFFNGRRWSKQHKVDGALNCVTAADTSHVFAGGSNTDGDAGVVHSFDGSKWSNVGEFPSTADRQGSPKGITAIAAPDYHHVWVAGDDAYIYNGLFWRIPYNPPVTFPPTYMDASDSEHVWAGTASGEIFLKINVIPLQLLFPKETFR